MTELQNLVELTQQVQRLVEAGDWSEAARLDRDRRPLMEAFMARHQNEHTRAEAAATVRKVIAMDRETLQAIGESRTAALTDASRSFTAGRAIRAYLEHPGAQPTEQTGAAGLRP